MKLFIGTIVGIIIGAVISTCVFRIYNNQTMVINDYVNILYTSHPHDGELTEWIYDVKSQDENTAKAVQMKVNEIAYIFAVASIGLSSEDQQDFIKRCNYVRSALDME